MRPLFALVLSFALPACGAPEPPPAAAPEPAAAPALQTPADSLAWDIVQGAGGLAAWDALDVLRFDFVGERDGQETFRRKLLWDKRAGRARLEYPMGPDTTVVAVVDLAASDPAAAAGDVWVNGARPDSAQAYLADAYETVMNDTYWLLAPLKVFDPGVRRSVAADSATADTRVLHLAFGDVGHTPGDQYWLRADAAGRVVAWTYHLEGGYVGHRRWTDYADLPTPAGPLHFAQTKAAPDRAIRTVLQPLPAGGEVMTRPTPML